MGRLVASIIGLLVGVTLGFFLMAPSYMTRSPWILLVLAIVGVFVGLVGYVAIRSLRERPGVRSR